ncbi:hypothetical protein YK48G_11640 [Lentilactobacillus fungorum]|uniref:Uncharacterized protein n=1 Tax=Lentilactobacillus fungorum TaxID=2201250 RepID=A0ABQ3VZH6_9LACO|nr:hypothetical protein YK48G_11640 [Lentilactobacillus fungorum]
MRKSPWTEIPSSGICGQGAYAQLSYIKSAPDLLIRSRALTRVTTFIHDLLTQTVSACTAKLGDTLAL